MSDAHIQALQVQVQALRAQVDTLAALVAQETDAQVAANEAVARSAEEVAKVIDRISSAGNGSVNQRLDDAQQEQAPKSEFESARYQGFDAMTEYFAKVTDDTCLAIELQAHDARQVERIRQVIREELRPGGMLNSR